MEPSELAASTFTTRAGAKILASSEPTCYTQRAAILDYFVVSDQLAQRMADIQVRADIVRPHWVAKLTFQKNLAEEKVEKILWATALDIEAPFGPRMQGADWKKLPNAPQRCLTISTRRHRRHRPVLVKNAEIALKLSRVHMGYGWKPSKKKWQQRPTTRRRKNPELGGSGRKWSARICCQKKLDDEPDATTAGGRLVKTQQELPALTSSLRGGKSKRSSRGRRDSRRLHHWQNLQSTAKTPQMKLWNTSRCRLCGANFAVQLAQ